MKIAILGGGVAGVSSAIALSLRGFEVSLYERHASPSHMGAGIVVWPNASFVLDQLGVLDNIKAVSGYPTQMCRRSCSGDELGTIDIGLINQHMGYPSLSILRRDLQNILMTRLEALDVTIHYSHTVTNIETHPNGHAVVHFQNGVKVTADIIIGADGRMASYARRYVNDNNAPIYQGFINWIGVFESKEDVFDEIAVADYWGIGERFGIVPVTKRKAYWAGGAASEDIGPRNPAEYKTELHAIFSAWPQVVRSMIELTPGDAINKIYMHDHNPMRLWHKHNLIAIGDAAHAPLPTSGQGACQALEDAWQLTCCLYENPNNIQQAFEKFTDLRLEKTTSIIMAARGFAASLFNRDKDACAKRDENSKRTDFSKVAAAMANGWAQGLPLST